MKYFKQLVNALIVNRARQAQGYINAQRFYY
jgi:hypothetical protein